MIVKKKKRNKKERKKKRQECLSKKRKKEKELEYADCLKPIYSAVFVSFLTLDFPFLVSFVHFVGYRFPFYATNEFINSFETN